MESRARFMQYYSGFSPDPSVEGVVYGSVEYNRMLAAQIGTVLDDDVDLSGAGACWDDPMPVNYRSSFGNFFKERNDDDDVALPRDYSSWMTVFPDVVERSDVAVNVSGAPDVDSLECDVVDFVTDGGSSDALWVDDAFSVDVEFVAYFRAHVLELVYATTFYAGDWRYAKIFLESPSDYVHRHLKSILLPYPWFVWEYGDNVKVIHLHHDWRGPGPRAQYGLFFSFDSVDLQCVTPSGVPGCFSFIRSPHYPSDDCRPVYNWDRAFASRFDYMARHFPSAATDWPYAGAVSCHLVVPLAAVTVVPRFHMFGTFRDKGFSPSLASVGSVMHDVRVTGVQVRRDDYPCAWVVHEAGWTGTALVYCAGVSYKRVVRLSVYRETPYSVGGFGVSSNVSQRVYYPWLCVVNGKVVDKLRFITTEHCRLDKYGCFGYGYEGVVGRTIDLVLPCDASYFPCWDELGGKQYTCGFVSGYSTFTCTRGVCYKDCVCGGVYPNCYDMALISYFGVMFDDVF